jgi:hypothetical protein
MAQLHFSLPGLICYIYSAIIHPSSRLARIRTGEQCSSLACMASTARRYGGSPARVDGNRFTSDSEIFFGKGLIFYKQ